MFMIFLDDERNPEDVTWMDYSDVEDYSVVRNTWEFRNAIENFAHIRLVISLDHDIQDFDKNSVESTGYDCLKWLCKYLTENSININNIDCVFHTQNPIGKRNMESYWNNFKEVYNIN